MLPRRKTTRQNHPSTQPEAIQNVNPGNMTILREHLADVHLFRRLLEFLALSVLIILLALLSGCGGRQPAVEAPTLLFPAPPAQARVQYLKSISTPADLPKKRSGFAEFVLGEEPVRYVLAKPISSALSGSKLYIADTILNTVMMYDLGTGESRPLLGDRGIGKIQQANHVTIDDEGRIYVSDKLRHAVLVYGPDEAFIQAFGRVKEVSPICAAVSDTEIYVTDVEEHEIEVWDKQTGELKRTIGGLGREPGQFFTPTWISLDRDGNLYVTDTGMFRVQKLSPQGDSLKVIGEHGNQLGDFAWPKGMDVDDLGRIYVTDTRFANVQVFDPEGRLLIFFGGPGPERGNLDLPAGLKVYPFPDVPLLKQRLAPNFDPEFLVIVISQKGAGYVNFYAVASDPGAAM